MAQPVPVVIHERIAFWARQVRPRVHGWSVRVEQSRSIGEFRRLASKADCLIAIIDLAVQPAVGLEAIHWARTNAPDALTLALDGRSLPGVAPLARELGATRVVSGFLPPPAMVDLLARWLPLAVRRIEADGWSSWTEPSAEAD